MDIISEQKNLQIMFPGLRTHPEIAALGCGLRPRSRAAVDFSSSRVFKLAHSNFVSDLGLGSKASDPQPRIPRPQIQGLGSKNVDSWAQGLAPEAWIPALVVAGPWPG